MTNKEIRTVYINYYPVYEDEEWLTSTDDIIDTANDIRKDYMSADSEGYCNFAEVLFKIGDKYYLVTMEAEVHSTWTEYGDVLHIGKMTSCTYEEVLVTKLNAYVYEGEFTFEGDAIQWEDFKHLMESKGAKLVNVVSKEREVVDSE